MPGTKRRRRSGRPHGRSGGGSVGKKSPPAWYAATSVLVGVPNRPSISVRVLTALDMDRGEPVGAFPIEAAPARHVASEVTGFLEEQFKKSGPPRVGVVLTRWLRYSSLQLLGDPVTEAEGKVCSAAGVSFAAMADSELDAIRAWLAARGLRHALDPEEILR